MANPYLQQVSRDVCVNNHDNNHNSIALETEDPHFAEMAVADDKWSGRVDEFERAVRSCEHGEFKCGGDVVKGFTHVRSSDRARQRGGG